MRLALALAERDDDHCALVLVDIVAMNDTIETFGEDNIDEDRERSDRVRYEHLDADSTDHAPIDAVVAALRET